MWYLDENGDISEIKTKNSIKLTDEQTQQVIDAKLAGLLVSYEDDQLIFTEQKQDDYLVNEQDELINDEHA